MANSFSNLINTGYTGPTGTPWDDPWGDESVESLGKVVGGQGRYSVDRAGFKGKLGNTVLTNGLLQQPVGSLEEAQDLVKRFGGTLKKGYGVAAGMDDGHGGTFTTGTDDGFGYYYQPPGSTPEEQTKTMRESGLWETPKGLDALSDGQFLALVGTLFIGGAAAGGAFGGAGATTGASSAAVPGFEAGALGGSAVGTGATGTAASGLGGLGAVEGFEAAALTGPTTGTGLQTLTQAELLAASASPEVLASVAQASGMTPAELTAYMANPATTYPGGSPSTPTAPTAPTSTTPSTGAPSGSNSISELLKNNKELLGIGSSLIGGITGSNTAKSAASQQQEGINKAIEELRKQNELGRADLAPYRERGGQASDRMSMMMGLNPNKSTYQGDIATANQSPIWNSGYQTPPQYSRNSLALPMKIIKGY